MDKEIIMLFTPLLGFMVSSSVALGLGVAALATGAAVGGAAAAGAFSKKKSPQTPGMPALPASPTPPSGAEATSAEKARIRRKTKTILTGPLTGAEDFGKPAPTLLGSGTQGAKTKFGQ